MSERVISGMKERLERADAGIQLLAASGKGTRGLTKYLTMAKDCLASGRYARLYSLLQESWVTAATKSGSTVR